jgi:hypothetical protein
MGALRLQNMERRGSAPDAGENVHEISAHELWMKGWRGGGGEGKEWDGVFFALEILNAERWRTVTQAVRSANSAPARLQLTSARSRALKRVWV